MKILINPLYIPSYRSQSGFDDSLDANEFSPRYFRGWSRREWGKGSIYFSILTMVNSTRWLES